MKLPLAVPSLAIALLAALPLPSHSQMAAPAERVRVEVRVESSMDRKELKNTTTDTVTQHKMLEILLSGKPKTPENRTVHWAIYGRDLKDKDVRVLERGQFALDLSDRGLQKMQSKKASTTSTPPHAVVKRRGGNWKNNKSNNNSRTTKKVAGAGTKYVGYAVQVRAGKQILGEAYDPPGMKVNLK
ncbi:MAG: hypothetical protein ACO1QR_08660 [Chthoniobacteraceae bacterium]